MPLVSIGPGFNWTRYRRWWSRVDILQRHLKRTRQTTIYQFSPSKTIACCPGHPLNAAKTTWMPRVGRGVCTARFMIDRLVEIREKRFAHHQLPMRGSGHFTDTSAVNLEDSHYAKRKQCGRRQARQSSRFRPWINQKTSCYAK